VKVGCGARVGDADWIAGRVRGTIRGVALAGGTVFVGEGERDGVGNGSEVAVGTAPRVTEGDGWPIGFVTRVDDGFKILASAVGVEKEATRALGTSTAVRLGVRVAVGSWEENLNVNVGTGTSCWASDWSARMNMSTTNPK